MISRRLVEYTLMILAGALQTFAICSPVDALTRGWLQVMCLAVLINTINGIGRTKIQGNISTCKKGLSKTEAREAFNYSFTFSISWLASTFWWIYISLHVYGGMPSTLAVVSVLFLAGGLSLYYALACTVYTWVNKGINWIQSCIIFGALWTLAELARAQWFTGFPWGAIGYAHIDSSLKLMAPYIGVYGVGFTAATLACAISQLIKSAAISIERRKIKFGSGEILAMLLLAATLIPCPGVISWIEQKKDEGLELSAGLTYSLLQGNISQEIKFEAEGLKALNWYKSQILSSKSQLTVTPETALPVLKRDLPSGYWQEIIEHFKLAQHKQDALLIGMVGAEGAVYSNRVVGINTRGEDYIYNKHHLVPFGEFIPSWFKWFTDLMRIPLGSFKRGDMSQVPWSVADERIAVNICYEDVFGEEIAGSFTKEGIEPPTLMVNASNIGWFGPLWAVEQHLNASKMRAIEMRRPMLRATNTGATAAIDQNGYVIEILPKGEVGVLSGVIKGVNGPATPYAQWSGRYSLYPMWAICLGIVLWAFSKRNSKYRIR